MSILAKGHEKITLTIITIFPIFLFYGIIYPLLLFFLPLILLLLCFHFYFFRDPEREVRINPKYLLAPADGTIYEVNYTKGIIKIRMSLFNVHVNRMPISGKITSISYQKGKNWPFLPFINRGSVENTRQIFHIENFAGEFTIIQIAGILARTCTSYFSSGEYRHQGERFGIIHYGSEVDIHFPPKKYEIIVRKKVKTIAGITILAKLNQ